MIGLKRGWEIEVGVKHRRRKPGLPKIMLSLLVYFLRIATREANHKQSTSKQDRLYILRLYILRLLLLAMFRGSGAKLILGKF